MEHNPEHFRNLPERIARGEVLPSQCGARPTKTSISATIRKLISELGARYEPSVPDEGFAGRLALLAKDLADAKPDLLAVAIDRWVRIKPFLPKVSELLAIMESVRAERTTQRPPSEDGAVEYLNRTKTREDVEWYRDRGGGLQCRLSPNAMAKHYDQCAEEQERGRQKFNHRLRYPVTAEVRFDVGEVER